MDRTEQINWLQSEAAALNQMSVTPADFDGDVEAFAVAQVGFWETTDRTANPLPDWYDSVDRQLMIEHIIRSYE